MARSRNIKPGFFTHDAMAENEPLGRLLFLGLTTLADFKGCLEWRPKRIKTQLLPYDDCDVEALAINLDLSGFVRFYSDGEKTYLHIVNFVKHQNPHKNEKAAGSEIPEYTEKARQLVDIKGLTINRDKSRINHEQDGTAPADSLNLIPDSLSRVKRRFAPPERDEVHARIIEMGYRAVSADDFVNFYASKNWMVGKNKMADWHKALAGWESRHKSEAPVKLRSVDYGI